MATFNTSQRKKWKRDPSCYLILLSPFRYEAVVPRWLVVKNPLTSEGDVRDSGLIPELGRSPGGGNGKPLQKSCLENPMDKGGFFTTEPPEKAPNN